MNAPNVAKAFLVGGGIASLSAAVLLIRDAAFLSGLQHPHPGEVPGRRRRARRLGRSVEGLRHPRRTHVHGRDHVCLWDVLQRARAFDFSGGHGHRITAIHGTRHGEDISHAVGPHDYAFLTIGSMTADSRYGDDDHPPRLVRDKADGARTLWENMARRAPGFGRPYAFSGNIDESKWESFALTMRSPTLVRRIEEFTGNKAGTGGLMTFKDSSWLVSIVVPHPPHFAGQADGVFTLWGYGLLALNTRDDAVHHQPIPEARCARPPRGNPQRRRELCFARTVRGIPEDVVSTVEHSVRAAMHGVYGLARRETRDPGHLPRHRGPQSGPLESLKTLMG